MGIYDSVCSVTWVQTSRGCAAHFWRYEPDGYLREVLTARVYDVAIQSPLVSVFVCVCVP